MKKFRKQNEEILNKKLSDLKHKQIAAEERLKKKLKQFEREENHKKVSHFRSYFKYNFSW